MITIREYLAKHYPLHFQRICECIHEGIHWVDGGTEFYLSLPARPKQLRGAFVWGETSEGWEYWSQLSRQEDC